MGQFPMFHAETDVFMTSKPFNQFLWDRDWNANGRRTFVRMCSMGNLVLHFLKSFIFHDT